MGSVIGKAGKTQREVRIFASLRGAEKDFEK